MIIHIKYYTLDFNAKTDRKFLKLLVTKKDIYKQRIDMSRIDYDSIKFENMPKDIHLLGCWYDFSKEVFIFMVEHESFNKIAEGCEVVNIMTKIIDCIRLIKLAKNL